MKTIINGDTSENVEINYIYSSAVLGYNIDILLLYFILKAFHHFRGFRALEDFYSGNY